MLVHYSERAFSLFSCEGSRRRSQQTVCTLYGISTKVQPKVNTTTRRSCTGCPSDLSVLNVVEANLVQSSSSFHVFLCQLFIGSFSSHIVSTAPTSLCTTHSVIIPSCSLSVRKEAADTHQGHSPPYVGTPAFVPAGQSGLRLFSTQNHCLRAAAVSVTTSFTFLRPTQQKQHPLVVPPKLKLCR